MNYAMNALLHYAGVCYERGYLTRTEYDAILGIVLRRARENRTIN